MKLCCGCNTEIQGFMNFVVTMDGRFYCSLDCCESCQIMPHLILASVEMIRTAVGIPTESIREELVRRGMDIEEMGAQIKELKEEVEALQAQIDVLKGKG